jgi:hypothetical protein
MKTTPKTSSVQSSSNQDFVTRSQAAAKIMTKQLRAEHKRWNMPLLTWKDGKVVAVKP